MEKKNKVDEYHWMISGIKEQGGLVSWANFGCRLGFVDDPLDFSEYVEEMIRYFENEDMEICKYLSVELQALKDQK